MHHGCVAGANQGGEGAAGWWPTLPSCRWAGRPTTPASWPPTTSSICPATGSPQAGGTDRQGDGGADSDQPDQDQGEQGAGDSAQVVHGPLEPVGAVVDAGGDDVSQQGVAGRDPEASSGPGPSSQHGDLPDGSGGPDQAGEIAVVV
jgi:hypothetical protein